MEIRVRPAHPADDAETEQIEAAADALLVDRFDAVDWPPPTTARERASMPGFVLVAEPQRGLSPLFGAPSASCTSWRFDGHAHLEQLSVLPTYGRRGIGRRLVQAALSETRGPADIVRSPSAPTVTVPWNAPFYGLLRFTETEPDSALLRSLIDTETALGLFRYGPRVQMTATL